MHVGVEEAVAQRVGQEGLDDPLGERGRGRRRWPRSAGEVAEVDAVDPFERQHAAAGGRPDHRRHAEAGVARRCWRRTRPPRRPPCAGRARPAPRPRNGRSPPAAAAGGRRAASISIMRGGEVEGVDVAQEGALDARAQHLDRDDLAGLAQASRGGPGRARRRRPAARSSAKSASTGWPSSRSTAARASAIGKGGSLSCSTVSWAASSGPTTSGRVESELAELDVGRPERGQRPQDRRLGRVALEAEPLERPAEHAGRRRAASAARRAPRARAASRRCARRSRRCGSGARGCAGRASELPAPSAARRCPSRGCG